MADQENCVRVTRLAAKKRAAAESSQEHNKKKRVVLGEIQNVVSSRDLGLGKKMKCDVAMRKKEVKPKRVAKNSKSSVKDTSGVKEDYDSGFDVNAESDDPQMCGAYVSDIYGYLHSMEMDVKRRPLADYLEKIQKDVTANMRGILLDWLVEVAEEYKLVSDSLYLTVSYIDRFLSTNSINRQKLQLLGVSSMLIASKYEEITPPHVEDFCYITDNTYTKEEVVKMEADVLKSLKFEMGNPTVKTFLRRFTRIAQEDYKDSILQVEFLGYYLAELSLLDYECIKFLPSLIAASVIFLTRYTLQPNQHPWNLDLQRHSRYKAMDLKECVHILHDLQLRKKGASLLAVREKYNQHKVLSNEGFTRRLRLPIAFMRKHGEILAENVLLRASSGESWVVKLEHIEDANYFTLGWSKFADDLGLRIGEFLVFFLAEKSTFDVSLFGISGCERAISNHKSGFGTDERVEILEKEARNVDRSSPLYFEMVLKKHHISRVHLSVEFAKKSGLIRQNRVVLEYVPKQHFTTATLHLKGRSRLDLTWPGFVRENQLVFGRTYSFEFNPKTNVILVNEKIKV
ncbi:hypothetical protein F511_01347 [Dorcoceras hygrometricum]|uniref:TF-B3 domain-containing protein n=1 Tax=Dorcoceras hygrometricum TaxID=472368 RepID=A0A2Z7D7L5_9LAMI|nr:hypothetical protein F511_01347 [Dorcoceras hygrometricum]